MTTILYSEKCYGEESQDISTIKTQHGIQRRLLKGGDMWANIGGWVNFANWRWE